MFLKKKIQNLSLDCTIRQSVYNGCTPISTHNLICVTLFQFHLTRGSDVVDNTENYIS